MITAADITIAVVTHGDHPDLFYRCVNSIGAHTPGARVIACLNGCPWKVEMPGGYDTVIQSRENIGIEGAIHLALQACRTSVLVRLDDDSWILKDGWLDILLAELNALPPTWGVLGRLIRFGETRDGPPGQGYLSRDWMVQQPWFPKPRGFDREAQAMRRHLQSILYGPCFGISGGFCALNVAAAIAVFYPTDSYGLPGTTVGFWEEDLCMGFQMRANGFSLHNSVLINELAKDSDKLVGREPYVAVGDAPSRTDRAHPRRKWKGTF